MIEDKDLWKLCLLVAAVGLGAIKAFIIARNPLHPLSGVQSPSQLNSFSGSDYFIVRFLYDFVGSFTNIPYLLCLVTPASLILYFICRFFS